MSRVILSCLRSRIWRRRNCSSARRFAIAISQAPGFSGTPVAGQCSSAANSASCVISSASGTSRSIRDRLVISRGCSIRQTARMVRLISTAVMTADRARGAFGSRASKPTKFAGPLPARHVVPVQLHEFLGGCQRLLLVAEFEDRVAANHLLGLHERALDAAELAVLDADLGAGRDGHQPAAVEHAAGL